MNDMTSKRTRRPAATKGEALAPEAAPAAAAPLPQGAVELPADGVLPLSAAVTGALAVIAHAAPAAGVEAGVDVEAEAAAPKAKVKLLRASFSLSKEDHATLADLKQAVRDAGVDAKKSQLLRVAVGLLREVEPARLAQLVAALPSARKRK